jgi:aryl-alcohol dehydrogenase-like predicted oxidoreductase
VQTVVYSPLARGRLARPWGETTDRSEAEPAAATLYAGTEDSNRQIVGALKAGHIDDAIAALSITLTDEEAARLEAPYIPRRDVQGVSDPAEPARMMKAAGIEPAAA